MLLNESILVLLSPNFLMYVFLIDGMLVVEFTIQSIKVTVCALLAIARRQCICLEQGISFIIGQAVILGMIPVFSK